MVHAEKPSDSGHGRESIEQRLTLLAALFQRPDLGAAGMAAMRSAFPHAPDAMLHTAAFHVYVDGCDAALAFLADAERFLRDPSRPLDYSITYELLYHLYNWHQFQVLLPEGRQEILDLVAELKQFVAEDDRDAIVKTADALEDILDGSRAHPDFE